MRIMPSTLMGRVKPPRGMAVVNRAHPIGSRVTACWAFNEGGGGSLSEIVSGVQCPITLNGTEANRPKWRGSSSGNSSLDFIASPVTGNYARGRNLQRVTYTRGISFFGVFWYPTGGTAGSNRALISSRTDGFNGLMWSYFSSTVTITTKGWGGWSQNTSLTPAREQVIAFVGSQATNGDVRMWMNGKRYSTTGTSWSSPTVSEWYVGIDSSDTSRQWHGQVYLAGVLHGALTWGEMEAWGRAPFEFLWPNPKRNAVAVPSSGSPISVASIYYFRRRS